MKYTPCFYRGKPETRWPWLSHTPSNGTDLKPHPEARQCGISPLCETPSCVSMSWSVIKSGSPLKTCGAQSHRRAFIPSEIYTYSPRAVPWRNTNTVLCRLPAFQLAAKLTALCTEFPSIYRQAGQHKNNQITQSHCAQTYTGMAHPAHQNIRVKSIYIPHYTTLPPYEKKYRPWSKSET